MKDRLLEFLRTENKSSAQLAEEIGVQPSGISHILSGRNKPSLDFVLKMLERYKYLSTEWLLFGRGNMFRDIKMQSLFDEYDTPDDISDSQEGEKMPVGHMVDKETGGTPENSEGNLEQVTRKSALIRKIVMFFEDNSFEEYYPR